MNKQMGPIAIAGMLLGVSAVAEDVPSVNVVGYSVSTTLTVTGAVAYTDARNLGVAVGQIAGTTISVVIRGLTAMLFEGPPAVEGSAVWMQITSGRVSDILVDGVPLPLASQVISNGVIRTKDCGICSIYLCAGSSPAALFVEQQGLLKRWLDARKQDAAAEQQGGGYSPPAARPSKPTP